MKTQPQNLTMQELKQGLAQTRERVLKDMQVLEEEFRAAVHFKTWVERDPWLWIVGAAGVGFLLGVLSSQRGFKNF